MRHAPPKFPHGSRNLIAIIRAQNNLVRQKLGKVTATLLTLMWRCAKLSLLVSELDTFLYASRQLWLELIKGILLEVYEGPHAKVLFEPVGPQKKGR